MDLFDKRDLPTESPEPERNLQKAGLATAKRGMLSDYLKDWFFVAPAVPYLHILNIPLDLIRSFSTEKKEELDVMLCMAQRPFFDYKNLTDDVNNQYWAHSLVALPAEYKDDYLGWVGSLTFVNRPEKTLYIVRVQPLQVYDHDLGSGFVNPSKTVPVSGLVLETNKYSLFYQETNGLHKVIKSAEVVYDDTKELADKLLTEK